jgi:hypothetical protein
MMNDELKIDVMKTEKDISIESPEIESEDTSCFEPITQPFSPSDIKLSTPPMNMGDIIDAIEYKYIDFDTDYQREENLWNDIKQSQLIESIMLGLRLPAFYFEEVSKKQWRIIDGLQRCCAIRNFCIDKTLKLTGLEFLTKYNGYKFDDFPFDIKRDIRMLPVTVNVLESGTPDEVKYVLFKRLNTGGIQLSPQEIRNAVYIGKAIDIVKEMSKYEEFTSATMNNIPTLRKQDMDFISRFVSFYLVGYQNYQLSDLDNFINSCMKGLKEGKYDHEIESMKLNFKKAMKLAKLIFEEDAFRKRTDVTAPRNRLNKAYFEVISVGLAKLSDVETNQLLIHKDLFKQNLIAEMSRNKSYNDSFSGGTAQKDSVKKRFSVFNEILSKSMNGITI